MRYSLLLLFSLLFTTASSAYGQKRDRRMEEPPGTVQVNDTLYFDVHEATNFSWLEYMYWNEKVFGKSSKEYAETLPDTLVWSTLPDSLRCYSIFSYYYLRLPYYRDYPTVGITYSQVANYTKWRNDRVMEYMLIRDKKLGRNDSATAETHFTIERYFSGQYVGGKPKPGVYVVPNYRIPSKEDLQQASAHVSNISVENAKKWEKGGDWVNYLNPYLFPGKLKCSADNDNNPPMPLQVETCPCAKKMIYWLNGNLPEISTSDLEKKEKPSNLPTELAFKTFRNAFVWETIEVK